jgi:hypothetical protein
LAAHVLSHDNSLSCGHWQLRCVLRWDHTNVFTQAYYRRGDANFAMGKFKLALKDFRTVRWADAT